MTRRPQPQTRTVKSATLGSDCCTSGLWRSSAWSFQLHHGRLVHCLHHQAAALSDCCTSGLWRSSAWSFLLRDRRQVHLRHQPLERSLGWSRGLQRM